MAKRPAKVTRRRAKAKAFSPPPLAPPRKKQRNRNTSGLKPNRKGERRVGRQKGTPNKLGARIKECVLEAIELVGKDGKGKHGATGYFMWLARAEPQVMGAILQKILPMQIEMRDKTERMLTAPEAVERLKERGLPVPPTLLSLAQSIGQAAANLEDENYEAELSGDGDGDEEDDDSQEEAA